MDLPPAQYPGPMGPKPRRIADRDRKRAARACDGCRRQKEKCDGGVPCRRCIRLRRACMFRSQHDLHALDRFTSQHTAPRRYLTDDHELAQRAQQLEKLLTYYAGNISLEPENLHRLAEAIDKEQETCAAPHLSKAIASDNSQGADLSEIGDEKFVVQPLGNNITHYSGEFSYWNFSMRIKKWIEQSVRHSLSEDDSFFLSFKEYYRAEELQSTSTARAALSSLPPRYVADFLVTAFFNHAEPNYFFVERGWLLDKINIAYQEPHVLGQRDVGTVCIIFIVMAIGTQYAYLESPSGSAAQPDLVETSRFSEDRIGVMFYQQVCKLVPDVITVSSLESVQACLLIGIYALPIDASGLSYIYLNLAVKLAIQNGMHRRYSGEGMDPVIRETRCRVWWSAYTAESRVSIFHGRPVSIASAEVDAELPEHHPDLWSMPVSHTAHMTSNLQLHQILKQISREIFKMRTNSKFESLSSMDRLVSLKNELTTWWESLPQNESSENSSDSSTIDRSSLHLKLEYCLVRIFAGRPFLMPRDGSASTSPIDENQYSNKCSSKTILAEDCVDAALTVINSCKLIRDSVGLARASYTEFSACRAALLVIIAQCLQKSAQKHTQQLRTALQDGMSLMRFMSSGGESARSDASLIEAFEQAIHRLDTIDATSNDGPGSEYSKFKEWESFWKDGAAQRMNDESASAAPGISTARMLTESHWELNTPGGQDPSPAALGIPFFALDHTSAFFPAALDERMSPISNGPQSHMRSTNAGPDDAWLRFP